MNGFDVNANVNLYRIVWHVSLQKPCRSIHYQEIDHVL